MKVRDLILLGKKIAKNGLLKAALKCNYKPILFCGLVLVTFLLVTVGLPVTARQVPGAAIVQTTGNSSQLLEEGRQLYQAGRFTEAISLWQQAAQSYQAQGDNVNQALSFSYLASAYQDLGEWELAQNSLAQSLQLLNQIQNPPQSLVAQIVNMKGSLELATGKTDAALETWKQAEKSYTQAGDEIGVLGTKINQAQALQTLGLYRRSQVSLGEVNQILQVKPDSALKATGLRSLGVALQVVGDLTESRKVLQQSLAITQKLNLPAESSITLFSLANTSRALADYPAALDFYQQAIVTAPTKLTKLEAQLNQLSLLIERENWTKAETLIAEINSELVNLNPSRAVVYAQVNFAESLIKYQQKLGKNNYGIETAKILAQANQQALKLQDQRAQSYSVGTLAKLYELSSQWQEAQKLTEQALQLAQSINAFSISYQWQWQLGRILQAQGDLSSAIAAETGAVRTLQSIRSDLVAINPDVQFSFRESVEPVYRNLVALLLTAPESGEISQENLKQARQTIESLQLAELDNFFRDACLDAQPAQIDAIDPKAAVIYTIILPDRLAVILSPPGQPLKYYQTSLPQSQIGDTLDNFLQSLNPVFSNELRLQISTQVYDWLIRPAEAELVKSGVNTLVFVLDGSLRNLPMSALYDGQDYLIRKYNIAVTPGLQLLQPKSLQQQDIKAVTAGVSEANQGFAALPGVEVELTDISAKLPSTKLLNQQFTSANLKQLIQETSFPILHLATHGQFSSNPDDTFVLTWNDRVKVKEFESLIRSRATSLSSPIELLVLSACQTASGDKQAALGLAGMAVRSGARSTIATLWSVKDESTALMMNYFYENLTQSSPGMSKAEALRQAQLALIESQDYNHPFYWSPFILVGNWL